MRLHLGIFVDDEDLDLFVDRTLYAGQNGYAYISTWREGPQLVHGIVMGGHRKGFHIDHINGNRLDARKGNLRYVSFQKNQVNRHGLGKNNTSGVRGVGLSKVIPSRPWRAQITVNRKNIYLGSFSSVEEATAARKAAELHYYGEECP